MLYRLQLFLLKCLTMIAVFIKCLMRYLEYRKSSSNGSEWNTHIKDRNVKSWYTWPNKYIQALSDIYQRMKKKLCQKTHNLLQALSSKYCGNCSQYLNRPTKCWASYPVCFQWCGDDDLLHIQQITWKEVFLDLEEALQATPTVLDQVARM